MSKKIRLGYDILSKRAIETESGVNIDDALKRHDNEISSIHGDITDIHTELNNLWSNTEYVWIDPVNGDDMLDGLSRNTAVKHLSKAAELYVSRFGGTKVVARLITIPGPESFIKTKSNETPNPGNCTNLFTTVIPDITDVYLIGEGSLCLSNMDYQTTVTNPVSYEPPNYNIHADMGGAVGVYCYSYQSMYWMAGLDIKSSRGDVYVAGSYGKDLPFAHLVADKGLIFWYPAPSFNPMAGITTDYYFDGQIVDIGSPVCGKSLHVVSRSLEHQVSPGSYAFGNWIGYGWIKGDILIESNSSMYVDKYCFCSGKFIVRSLDKSGKFHDYNDSPIQPTLEIMQPINGRGNDDTSYNPGTPSSCTFPDIDIDWNGTVLLSTLHANNVHIKAAVFAMYASGPVLSQNDIYVEAERIALNSYSTNNFWYCQGKMTFRSPNEIKIAQYLNTDELVIDAGGRPNDYPIMYSDYKYPYWGTTGVTGTSDVHCKITNLFECILGGADPILSTDEAHYFVKCSGDYADQWSTITNGNAIVSLDVGGHAYLSGNGTMIVKRFTLKSKSTFITNSGIYASSFDIKTGQLFWNSSGYLNQWVSYESGWSISQNKSCGASWSNDFVDRSSLNCDSLEQLMSTTSGFVHPGYGQSRHDWVINIKVVVPYRRSSGYYRGGPEYAVVLGYIYQGTFNGSIAGEIGDVLVTDQKQSPYSHDWIFPYYYHSYYENNKFGNNVTLHIAHRKWHHIYIDMDQGSDAYDGMSKETPVKSTYGLDKVFKQMLYPASYVTIHICGSTGNGNRGSTQTQYGPYSSIDFSYVIKTFDGGLLYNWYAAYYLSQNLSDVGVPTGWRVPTRSDFTTLRNTGNNEYLRFMVPDLIGTDQYGFSDIGQKGYSVGNDGVFGWSRGPFYWTFEENGTNYGYCSGIQGDSYDDKCYLFPMRLVRDNTGGDATGTTGTVEIGGTTYNTVVIGTQVWITKNLEFKFSGGTFRDSLSSNHFDQSSTPQYGYYNYGNNSVPYSMNDNPVYSIPSMLTIVADDPYLSATVKGPIRDWNNTPSMLKMYGFHTLNVLDCFAYVTDLQASVDLYYVAYTSTQSNYPKMSILRLRGGNVYTMGIAAGYNTAIEADNNYRCLSGTNNTGSGNAPAFYGATYIHAKYIDFTGSQCTFGSGICGSLIADTGFRFGTPIKFEYGSLSIIANGSGNIQYDQAGGLPDSSNTSRCYFGIGNWYGVGNISLICPNQDLYVYTWGQSEKTNGRLIIEANELTSYSNLYGCDIDIHTKNNTQFYGNILGEGGRSSLVRFDCGGELSGAISTRCCNMKINARKLISPITIVNDSNSSFDTNIYVNTEYAANGVFSIDNPVDSNYNLFARIVELSGPFYVYNGTPPLTYDGNFIKKFKGIVEFYTGSNPDTDLADFRAIAPDADFELIVLNRAKQLVAGHGIDISDTGDEIVVSADPKSMIVQIPVAIANGVATATLSLNRYNVITGIDSTVTDLVIDMPVESTESLLTEVGFEFYLDAFSQTLNSVTFTNSTEQLSSIVPDEFTPEHIYQGVLVNRCITLVEYDRQDINALDINGKKYRTVKIGNQTWMAENLADASSGVWYNNDQATYEPLGYGKLYTVAEAQTIANSVTGWHLPTKYECELLIDIAGGEGSDNGKKLKSKSDWNNDHNGTDDFGFNAKPAGELVSPTYQGSGTDVWITTNTESDTGYIYCLHIGGSYPDSVGMTSGVSSFNSHSVRLVKDMSVNIGGRDYRVVRIGNQLWMAENLDWKFTGLNFRDSSSNPLDDTSAIQAAYYNYDESTYGINGNKYGLLYNWYAVDYLNQHLEDLDVPEGWHIPTNDEYHELVNTCGTDGGIKLKSTSGWTSNPGIDYYGFNATPAGHWYWYYSNFFDLGSYANLWSSTPFSNERAYMIFVSSNYTYITETDYAKKEYYSVRLVKNLT